MTTAYLTHPRFIEHDFPGHPEHAGRIQAVWQELATQSLSDQMWQADFQPASDEQILAVHSQAHLERLISIASQDRTTRIDADTYALPVSLEIARLAAGAVTGAVDLIAEGQANNALAIVRPPGHHATPDWQMGFCLLNNIAIAARHAQRVHGLERVMIIDYDVHHGNGTQDVFYADPSVLFISIHQSPLYPGSGSLSERGQGHGKGFTLNAPLPGGLGDGAYELIFSEVVEPAAQQFAPELMLVSAGFDAHWADPLAGMRLSLAGYDHIARHCLRLADEHCDGRIVFVMEGGYDLQALAHGWSNIARALLGIESMSDPYGMAPGSDNMAAARSVIDQVRRMHKR